MPAQLLGKKSLLKCKGRYLKYLLDFSNMMETTEVKCIYMNEGPKLGLLGTVLRTV